MISTIVGVVSVLLAIIGAIIKWTRPTPDKVKLDRAEEDIDAAVGIALQRGKPLETDEQRAASAAAELARRRLRRKRSDRS